LAPAHVSWVAGVRPSRATYAARQPCLTLRPDGNAALDVHKDSIRLAADRNDELLDERTLSYDHAAVERALSRWPRVRVCYEADSTGFGLYRRLRARGADCQVAWPRAGATGGAGQDRPRATRASWLGCTQPACSRRSRSPPPSARPPASWCAAGSRRGSSACTSATAARSCSERRLPGKSWGVSRRALLSAQHFERPARQATLETTGTCSTSPTPASSDWSASSERCPSQGRGASSCPGCAACPEWTP
jgi:hypothetical protein